MFQACRHARSCQTPRGLASRCGGRPESKRKPATFRMQRSLDTLVSVSLRFAPDAGRSGKLGPRARRCDTRLQRREDSSKMAFALSAEQERELTNILSRYPN